MQSMIERISDSPIIAAVRKEQDVDFAIASQVTAIFILNADIFNINKMVEKIKDSGKAALIHVDFIEGLGRDNKSIDYIHSVVKPDGIISTKSATVKYARENGIFTIQRFFLIDSLSYETSVRAVHSVHPDMLEIMPAVMPGVIRRVCSDVSTPVIAGGLIDTKEDIIEVLKAGALAASTGKKELWGL